MASSQTMIVATGLIAACPAEVSRLCHDVGIYLMPERCRETVITVAYKE